MVALGLESLWAGASNTHCTSCHCVFHSAIVVLSLDVDGAKKDDGSLSFLGENFGKRGFKYDTSRQYDDRYCIASLVLGHFSYAGLIAYPVTNANFHFDLCIYVVNSDD